MNERLQKIISNAGFASRRRAEALILAGEVFVNGKVVKELGVKADIASDKITVCGKLLKPPARRIYLALHKPPKCVSTLSDPQGRKTIKVLLSSLEERVFPVGRLDYDSEGLIIMTNDGDFAFRIGHPKFKVAKRYLARIDGGISAGELALLKTGVELADGRFKAVDALVTKTNKKSAWVLLTIEEGRNRVIRRAFAALDINVRRLMRVAIGAVGIEGIRAGEYRHLSQREIKSLLKNS